MAPTSGVAIRTPEGRTIGAVPATVVDVRMVRVPNIVSPAFLTLGLPCPTKYPVIVPAAKLPEASLCAMAPAIFASVAVVQPGAPTEPDVSICPVAPAEVFRIPVPSPYMILPAITPRPVT